LMSVTIMKEPWGASCGSRRYQLGTRIELVLTTTNHHALCRQE
jgi:hypothetical protein